MYPDKMSYARWAGAMFSVQEKRPTVHRQQEFTDSTRGGRDVSLSAPSASLESAD